LPVASSLKRLLRVRAIEEEQHKSALESAVAEVHQLDAALVSIAGRARGGRGLLVESAQTGQPSDWQAGVQESCNATDLATVVSNRRASAVNCVDEQRAAYLASRTRRRQAETLVEEALSCEARLGSQRDQQALDDWFRSRASRSEHEDAREGRQKTCPPF
jgi:flagellar export protein FliJ